MPPRKPDKKFERRAEDRPDEVLDAAFDLFLRDGFEATRVEDIAATAGISKATVYLYFPSKQALLEGIIRRSVAPIPDEVREAVGRFAGDPAKALRGALAIFADRLSSSRNSAIPMLVLREASRFPDLAEMYREEVLSKGLAVLRGIVAAGVASGAFRKVDPDLTIRNIVGPIMLHLLMARVFGIGDASPEGLRVLFDNHVDVLLNGLEADHG